MCECEVILLQNATQSRLLEVFYSSRSPCSLPNRRLSKAYSVPRLGSQERGEEENKYTKFCIGFKIRKSQCRTTLRLQFGNSKWFSSAALHGVILDWVEQQSIVKEITPGNQNFQETGQFCQTIFQG